MAKKEMFMINDEEDSHSHETNCGWFNWRPSCLNCFNSPRWLLVVICLFALIFGITGNGFTNVAITSIERQFELPSARSGLIPPSYDLSSAFSVVFVSFVGSRGRKPRWLASGMFLIGVGSLLFTLPQFLTEEYHYAGVNATLLCPDASTEDCTTGENSITALSRYLYVFIFAQIVFGIGAPSVYSLGVTFIDESVPSHTAGFYLGILSSCFIIGPAFGYIIGSVFLTFYTDFLTVDTTTLTIDANSPQWVGAWWLGYLFAAAFMFLLVIPLSCLPPELKGTKDIQDQRISQAHRKSKDSEVDAPTKKGSGVKWRDLPKVMKSLFTNPTFVLVTASSVSDGFFIGGAEVFLPKFLETQFGLTASFAALQTGLYLVIFGGGSLVMTGWIIKRFKLKVIGMLRMSLVTSVICMLALIGQLLSCDEIPLAGISVPYTSSGISETEIDVLALQLDTECNADCQCSTEEYNPVCGTHNGIAYFNPCHAGCTTYDEETKEFGNCTCIRDTIDDSLPLVPATSAIGICIGQCWQYYVYCVILAIITTTLLMNGTLLVTLILRCVPDHSRDYALGIYGFFSRVLGSFIGPILFGYLIDDSCILWHEECGERGRCWAYNRNKVALNMLLTGVIIKAITVVFFGLALWTYKPPIDSDGKANGKTNEGFQLDEAI